MSRPFSAPWRSATTARLGSVSRKPVLRRAATVPAEVKHAEFEVPFAEELRSDEECVAPEESSPTSPVTAAINRRRASQPSIAVVRRVPLSRPSSACEVTRQDEDVRPSFSRSGTKDELEKVDVRLRPLSREESFQRSASAVSFFKETQDINRRSRSKQTALGSALAAARERRRSSEAPALEMEPEPIAPEPQAPPPRRRSFAEQFGYGVILKTQLPPRPSAVQVQQKPRAGSAFMSLQAGDTDLLQRLAERRRRAAFGA
ncbi:unnamed protein product [Effrenium voratum]|uniref:Uncharacterized protein n=1 Tax=Effrenium voratum TaxID=2562239 RepID=A0AA36HW03_9DINO|nr:unnamed protein product [Effrenium voratum]CAJ1461278.1 unnamed protein product [Effrenium voratum]